MDQEIKIAIVDDHPILVEGIWELLDHVAGFSVVFSAKNGKELFELLPQSVPDVIIMDINMPGMNGIECTKRLKSIYPAIKVVILTMHNERNIVNQLIGVGADGCLLKSNSSKELIIAIKRIMENKSYYDTFQEFITQDQDKSPENNRLSHREEEIVRLVAKGLTNFQISEKLFIAENTVKTHRKNILKKLGLSGTSQLTLYAISNGII